MSVGIDTPEGGVARSDSDIALIPCEEAYEDMMRRVPDIRKIDGLLGWRPRYSLEETLSAVIESQRAASPLPTGMRMAS